MQMTTMPVAVIPKWTVGDRLRKARELTGLTINAFAAEIGLSRNTITKYEAGDETPKTLYLRAWALRTGVDPFWLETGGELPPTDPGESRPTNPCLFGGGVILGPWVTEEAIAPATAA